MSTAVIIMIVVAVVIVAAVVAVALRSPQANSRRLKKQFGPEYDRVVGQHGGDAKEAERELSDRVAGAQGLDIQPLDATRREYYQAQWAQQQVLFVDDPAQAVIAADKLLTSVLRERGYPGEDPYDALSVHHLDALPGYRASRGGAQLAQAADAPTEDLREAFVRARETFDSLVLDGQERPKDTATGTVPVPAPATATGPATVPDERQPVSQLKGTSDE